MDGIKTNEVLIMKNVLSYRGKMNQHEMMNLSKQIDSILYENNVHRDGFTATVTHEIISDGEQTTVDFEIKVPLDKYIQVSNGFECLKEFKIENALKMKVHGNVEKVKRAVENLTCYIAENGLVQVTPIYIVTIKEARTILELEYMETDVYVGIRK